MKRLLKAATFVVAMVLVGGSLGFFVVSGMEAAALRRQINIPRPGGGE